jgi:hypothetical protein
MVVRGARGLAGWLLCLAGAVMQPAQQERRRSRREGSACFLASDRTHSARLVARRAVGRCLVRTAPGRAADASTGFESKVPGGGACRLTPANDLRAASRRMCSIAPSKPLLRTTNGGGLQLYLESRRLTLCDGGRRSLLRARGRLVDERDDEGPNRYRCVGNGNLAMGKAPRSVGSLGSWQPHLHRQSPFIWPPT